MEDFGKISWHQDSSPPLGGSQCTIPFLNSPSPGATSSMATAMDLSRKSDQSKFGVRSETEEPEFHVPETEDVSAPDDADDEEECQISCLYVGIAHVESKSKESGLLCSYDVISDVDIEIGDVFQHVIDVPKTFKSQQGDDGRILVKKIKNAVGANHSQDLKIGYVPKCYLTKVPSLLDEVPALNRPSGNTQKLTPKPQKKSNQTFPNMVTKTEDKNDSKRSLGDESIAHKFRPPSLNQSVLKPSTAEMLADFSPHETKLTNLLTSNSQASRPFFNPKRSQPLNKKSHPTASISAPVEPRTIKNSPHLANSQSNHLLPNNTFSSIPQQNNLMLTPSFNGLRLDGSPQGGFLGALNPFGLPNSFPLLLHLLKNMPQLQQAAFTAAVMHRYQMMQMDSHVSQSETPVMTSPTTRWASDTNETFLGNDTSPRVDECEGHFNFDAPANVFASGLLPPKDSLYAVPTPSETLFPSSHPCSSSSISSSVSSFSKNSFSGGSASKLCNLPPSTASGLSSSQQPTTQGVASAAQFHHPSMHPLKKHGRGRPPYRSVELIVGMGVFEHGRFKKLTVRNKFGIGGKEAINVRCTAVAKEIEAAAIHQHKMVNKLIMNVDFTLVFPDGTPVKYLPGTTEPFVLKKYKEMRNDSWIRLRLFLCPTKHLIQANAASTISPAAATIAQHLEVASTVQNERMQNTSFLNIPNTP